MSKVIVEYKKIVFLVFTVLVLFFLSSQNYLLFHSLVEVYSIVIAVTIFIITWNSSELLHSSLLRIIGISMLFVGGVDFLHTLAYKGMGVFPEAGANLPTQLWIAGRYLQVVSIIAAIAYCNRHVSNNSVFGVFAVVTTALLFSIFYGFFPDCYVDGEGLTVFKIGSEYLFIAIYGFGAYLLYKNRKKTSNPVVEPIIFVLVLLMLTELMFTFYISVYGISNLLGHLFKLIAFYVVYVSIVQVGYKNPFALMANEVEESHRRLEKKNLELLKSSESLQGQYEQMLSIMDGLQAGVLLIDAGSRELIFMNKFASETLGISTNVYGKKCHSTLRDNAEVCDDCVFQHLQARKDTYSGVTSYEYKLPNSDKTFYSIDRIIRWKDDKDTFFRIIFDITDIKKAQQLRQDFDRINKHDLGNLLNNIQLSTYILEDYVESGEGIDDDFEEVLNSMNNSAVRARELIRESSVIFSLEFGESYSGEHGAAEIDIKKTIDTIVKSYRTIMKTKRIEVGYSGGLFEDHHKIHMNNSFFDSLFRNLISNAIEAAPEGSEVHVKGQYLEDKFFFSIINEGKVAEEIEDKFFEKHATAGKEGGTGLGTYAAKLIVEHMEGEITLDTGTPGQVRIDFYLKQK